MIIVKQDMMNPVSRPKQIGRITGGHVRESKYKAVNINYRKVFNIVIWEADI